MVGGLAAIVLAAQSDVEVTAALPGLSVTHEHLCVQSDLEVELMLAARVIDEGVSNITIGSDRRGRFRASDVPFGQ